MDITSYILAKQYIEDALASAGALAGKSAYEIACTNGFKGTVTEWLASLQGDTPEIGPNGTWVIGNNDTGVIASPSLAGYATEEFVNQQIANIKYPTVDLTGYATEAFVEMKCNEILNSIPTPPSYDEVIFDGGEIE